MIRTERGRVVYERKEHKFSQKDFARIMEKVAEESTILDMQATASEILQKVFWEKGMSLQDWTEWVKYGLERLAVAIGGPGLRIGMGVALPRAFTLDNRAPEEILREYTIRKLRETAHTIEGS